MNGIFTRSRVAAVSLFALLSVVASVAAATSLAGGQALKGRITADGSSTVGPFAATGAELFRKKEPGVEITVGISGTGGGFQRFCAGETDISNASRAIKASETANCVKNNVKYTAFTVANDGISIVVHKDLALPSSCISTVELKKIWAPGSKINNWKDVSPRFPDQKIRLFGPGTDSGTFEFFTEKINGKAKASRSDYTPSENDEVLVRGVSESEGAMGYFGYSYYLENKSKLKLLAVDSGSGCIAPSIGTVQNGRYKPLSRPLFIYVKLDSFKRTEVQGYLKFMIDNQADISKKARYISMTKKQFAKAKYQYAQAVKRAKG